MSRTEMKNGQKVYDAALTLAASGGGRYRAILKVLDVAKKAGVSKPTAQKYMRIMQQNEVIDRHPHYPGCNFYRWIGDI